MGRTLEEFEAAKSLLAEGMSAFAVARTLGIPRGTVQRWHHRDQAPLSAFQRTAQEGWEVINAERYCYLLGAYLGDGTVARHSTNSWSLSVINDKRYPEITAEILRAMAATFPRTPRLRSATYAEADVLWITHPAIPRAFPQHGPGRKHTRPIVLADWQRALTHAHPAALIRGLIHSDGCRSINHVKTTLPRGRVAEYHYVRYFFTNHSADIRGIFREHCELLGIRVTQSNHRNLSVSHRGSVAILERIVGEKT